jgi:hypothetical protein
MLKFLKQLLCKHKYVDKLKVTKFRNISGETVVTICEKCEKVKETKFYTNEEMAFKYK